ncbi:LPS translocon maturation chaperone LptM [Piscinibacterium candidicorallinum]|uniref:Lipoprotein n=1 Tax=Piscinibacterium candidicorallinum TaxID=1793872 RepID=A0ABV7H834_9BURK
MKSILFSGPPRSAAKSVPGALLAVSAAAVLGLSACGQRGPLVLPPKPQPVTPKSAAQSAAPPTAAPASAPAAADTTQPGRPADAQPSVTPNKEPRP